MRDDLRPHDVELFLKDLFPTLIKNLPVDLVAFFKKEVDSLAAHALLLVEHHSSVTLVALIDIYSVANIGLLDVLDLLACLLFGLLNHMLLKRGGYLNLSVVIRINLHL